MAIKPGLAPYEGSNTTHYSIVDQAGNAVSVTYTFKTWFGAVVTADKTGILMNNGMDDFTVKTGVPNAFGLVQGDANAIVPGQRPLSSMRPTIVTREREPVMATVPRGGSRIITVVLQSVLNVIVLSPDTRALLVAMEHKFTGPQPANDAALILVGAPALKARLPGTNHLCGANDPRKNSGFAAGYRTAAGPIKKECAGSKL